MRIGIFGGTFDPFTEAHYAIVKQVLKNNLVDQVVVLPSIVEYYRGGKTTFFKRASRRTILKQWFEDVQNVVLDFAEYQFAALAECYMDSSTLKSRRYMHMLTSAISRYGEHNEFFTIIGGDSLCNFKTWYRWQDILEKSKIIAIYRGNTYQDSTNDVPHIQCFIDKKYVNTSASTVRFNLNRTPCNALDLYLKDIPVMKSLVDTNLSITQSIESSTNDISEERCESNFEHYKTYDAAYEAYCKNENASYHNTFDRWLFDTYKKPAIDKQLLHTSIFDVVESGEVESGFKPIKVKSPDWVSIIVEKNGKFLMEKQLRHGLNREFEEFPCGMVENAEFPRQAALRELKEETGIMLKNENCLHYLGKYAANPAFMTNYMHYYHVNLDDAPFDVVDPHLDEHEHLTTYEVEKSTAFKNFLGSGGSAIMGCAWMLLMKNNLFSHD